MNRDLLRKALRLQICRQCFGAFVQYVQPGYLMGWVHERICAELDRFLADVVAKKSPRLMLTMPPRHGKLCADDTDVLTADGWKKHGSLVPGDFVYGVDGRPVRVLAVGEPDFATHRVTMTDGSFVDVHLDHEWTFRDRGRNRTRTVETREVLESSLWLGERGRRGGRARWQLPLHGPVAGTERDLPLPPYVLGVWLGDGTSTKPYITMSPQDMPIVKQSFAELGYHPSAEFLHKQTGVPTVAYSTGHAGVRGEFAHALCDLGVLGNKHIPEQYKTASVSQRLELLAGLIDTDGHVDATGRVRFSTIFPRLAEDVSELASSFGVRVGMYSVEPETSSSGVVGRHRVYVLSFNSFPGIPVRLDRKKPKKTPVQRRIAVASVEALPVPVPGRCIQVDAEDGLYLVTRRFIPTHNSTLASRCFPAYALGRYPDMSIIATSYSADLASRMNRDVQHVMDDMPYAEVFPDSKLAKMGGREGVRTSDFFEVVEHRGTYRSAGVGGGITGMGAECVDGDALVLTPQGAVKAREIVAGMTVIGYNLQTQTVRTCTVDAVRRKYATEIYRLHSNRGRSLDVTGNHPVFSRGRFIEAHLLAEGSPLLCGVRPRVYRDGLSVPQACQKRLPEVVLHEEVLRHSGSKEMERVSGSDASLRPLWQTRRRCSFSRQNSTKVLPRLHRHCSAGALGRKAQATCACCLPRMREGFSCQRRCGAPTGVLFQGVRRPRPWRIHDRQRQYPLERWSNQTQGEGDAGLLPRQEASTRKGQGVRCLRDYGKSAVPSCGSRPRQQCPAECRARVRGLPQGDSQAGVLWRVRDEVLASNQKIPCPDGRLVIDLQVSDCHNFFANGILVHNCIIIDDPVKDRAEADSPTISQGIWEWYTSTLYTRLAPGGGIIIIQTRWGDTDLSGRLLEAQAKGEGDTWRVINFPAIAEADEEHRRKGEALHPERYPLEALERIKAAIGTRDWEALYQQHPVPDGGAIFKDEWLQRTWLPKDLPARFDAVIMSWDLSFKGNDASDFVVGQLVGRHGADYYILDQLRGRWSFTETVAQVKELAERARVRFPRVAPRILIEDKANGPAVIDALKHEVSGIVPVEPDGSKEARAHAVTALFEAGNVLLPDRSLAPWVDEYRLELTRFPSGAHDDQVDATTQALRYLSAGHRLNIAPALQRQLQGFRFRR